MKKQNQLTKIFEPIDSADLEKIKGGFSLKIVAGTVWSWVCSSSDNHGTGGTVGVRA